MHAKHAKINWSEGSPPSEVLFNYCENKLACSAKPYTQQRLLAYTAHNYILYKILAMHYLLKQEWWSKLLDKGKIFYKRRYIYKIRKYSCIHRWLQVYIYIKNGYGKHFIDLWSMSPSSIL